MSRIKSLAKRLLRQGIGSEDEFTSLALRARYRRMGVDVGLYSYGCFDLGRVPAGVTIGRYCSFAPTSQIFLRNHGLSYLGLTPYFYNALLGVVENDTIEHATLTIEDDVWLGHDCVLLPMVDRVGRGAAIAAGAVVTRSVPPYAVVAGNPARIIRMRFDEKTIAAIEQTRWWELDTVALRALVHEQPELVFDPARWVATRDTTSAGN